MRAAIAELGTVCVATCGAQVSKRRAAQFATGVPVVRAVEVLAIVTGPWLFDVQAAVVLELSRVRVSQVASAGRLPVYQGPSGPRYYRSDQLRTVANAQRSRRFGIVIN